MRWVLVVVALASCLASIYVASIDPLDDDDADLGPPLDRPELPIDAGVLDARVAAYQVGRSGCASVVNTT